MFVNVFVLIKKTLFDIDIVVDFFAGGRMFQISGICMLDAKQK